MSRDAVRIRSAITADAPAIQAIYAPIVRDTVISFETEVPTVREIARRIGDTLSTHPYLVADIDGVVAGYAYASQHRSRSAYRWSADVTVYVAAEARRSGLGRALYGRLLPMLTEHFTRRSQASRCRTLQVSASMKRWGLLRWAFTGRSGISSDGGAMLDGGNTC